jgi:hypothetical protein
MARRLGLVAALLLVALTLPGAVPGVHAAAVEGSGWWWRVQAGLVASVPPPPYVPEGGLYVAGAPDGPLAVAALRFRLADDEIEPVLTLSVAEDRGGQAARLLACLAGTPWIPTEAGSWDQRARADCAAGEVEAEPAGDGTTWTVRLAPLVRAQRLDVVLTPGELGDAPGWSSFELAFEPVQRDSLETASAHVEEVALAPPAEEQVFAPPGDAAAGLPPTADSFAPQTFEAPAPDAPGVSEPDVAGPSAALPDPGVTGGPVAAPQETAQPELAGAGDPGRLLAALVLALTLAAMYLLAQRPVPAPQGLGRFTRADPDATQPQPGGLGRFARPRTGPPPPLR